MTPERDKYHAAHAALVAAEGPPQAARAPTRSWTAVLIALLHPVETWGLYSGEIYARTGVEQSNLVSLLRRMTGYGLLVASYETASPQVLGRGQRTYHRLTDKGRTLADLAQAAEVSLE